MKSIYAYVFCFLTLPLIVSGQTGYDYFDGNNIKALISPVGTHFWDYESRQMFVPKDSDYGTIFAFTNWLGGKHNDTLYLAAERYRQLGTDYLPGPTGDISTYEASEYAKWDRVWKITRAEVAQWMQDPQNNPVPQVVLDWPAYGNPDDGQAKFLAPFVDVNGDGKYNPSTDFDYPEFKGDQAVYFMFHDGWVHTESYGRSFQAEIHGMAYGFDCPEDTALNNTLFMEYRLINRSLKTYEDCYFGMWTDFDLGNPQDDYIGSDPNRNLFFAYQGDDIDNGEYVTNSPAQGIRILDGIRMDLDAKDNIPSVDSNGNWNGFHMNDQVVDNEELGLSHFVFHGGFQGPTSSPLFSNEYYSYMKGIWKDQTSITFGGSGHDTSNLSVPARFMYTDSSDVDFYSTYGIDSMSNPIWDEASAGNIPGDRKGLGSTGPFTFKPLDEKTITIAFVFAQKEGDRLGAVDLMKANSDHVQALYDAGETACGSFKNEFENPYLGQNELDNSAIQCFPNPATNSIAFMGVVGKSHITIYSVDGRKVIDQWIRVNETIDISQLSPGSYHISMTNDGKISYQTLIKL